MRCCVITREQQSCVGGLAQSEECVVRNDEAPGSKPGFSKCKCYVCRCGRVVKASDSKSDGFSRAGSNPVADVYILIAAPVPLWPNG